MARSPTCSGLPRSCWAQLPRDPHLWPTIPWHRYPANFRERLVRPGRETSNQRAIARKPRADGGR